MTQHDPSPPPNMEGPPNLALHGLDEKLSILVLVSGTLKTGESHYAYASIPPSNYQAFKAAQIAGSFKLEEFGSILFHGEGTEPPPEVKQRMTDEYGANHYFEQEMQQLMACFTQKMQP